MHNGTISGATLAAGIIGDSLAFDGVDDRVDVPGAPALDTAAGFTVAFWYLADAKQGSIIAKPYGTGFFNSWQFEFVNSGTALSFTSSNGSSQHFDTVPAPAAGTWIHVAGTWDGATKRLFINGAPALAVARSIAMGPLDVVTGGDYNSGSFVLPFKGRVDEVRMYDRALSDQQIRQLHQAAFAPETEASSTTVEAHFDTAADGFVYVDDAFRGTSQPGYASGAHATAEGFTGGALKVTLGGIDDATIVGMSGGWRRSFTLPAAAPVRVSFRYKLTQTSEYESDDLSEVLVRVDALQPGALGTDYVARLAGDGNGGVARTMGWQFFQADETLAAGTHILTIGGYNNKKTFHNEVTEVLIDDVVVTVR